MPLDVAFPFPQAVRGDDDIAELGRRRGGEMEESVERCVVR